MEIVYGDDELETFVRTAAEASREHPVLIDRFLEGAIEVDVDAVCDGVDVFIGAVMEHIEEAGVHSGDSSCQIPPATLSDEELDQIEDIARRLARRIGVVGLLNLQLAVKDEKIWVLEANPRASRTVPFVSKVIGLSLARIATLVLAGKTLADLVADGMLPADAGHYRRLPFTSVKAAVLPFGRFPGVDTVLGPEMRSTGEVMGIDVDPGAALAKAMVAAGHALPLSGTVFVSVANRDKRAIVFPAKRLADLGFDLLATTGTAGVLRRAGVPVEAVAKVSESQDDAKPNVADLIRAGRVDLVINTPFGRGPRTDGYHIRTAAAAAGVPCLTTMPGAFAAVRGIEALRAGATEPMSIQEHHAGARARPVQEQLGFDAGHARARGSGVA
jgi:carbamoyl-phosphate synthase large subunit